MKRGGPLPLRSERRVGEDEIYRERRERFLFTHRRCEIGWDRDCERWSSEVHHRISRGVRPDLWLDVSNFVAACRPCHRQATINPAAAYERGVSARSTDAAASSKIVGRGD